MLLGDETKWRLIESRPPSKELALPTSLALVSRVLSHAKQTIYFYTHTHKNDLIILKFNPFKKNWTFKNQRVGPIKSLPSSLA